MHQMRACKSVSCFRQSVQLSVWSSCLCLQLFWWHLLKRISLQNKQIRIQWNSMKPNQLILANLIWGCNLWTDLLKRSLDRFSGQCPLWKSVTCRSWWPAEDGNDLFCEVYPNSSGFEFKPINSSLGSCGLIASANESHDSIRLFPKWQWIEWSSNHLANLRTAWTLKRPINEHKNRSSLRSRRTWSFSEGIELTGLEESLSILSIWIHTNHFQRQTEEPLSQISGC